MIATSLIAVLTLLWSGVAKLSMPPHPVEALSGVGLPQRRIFVTGYRLLPFAEIIVGLCWVVLPLPSGLIATGIGVLLYLGFTVVVVRAKAIHGAGASCACFGSLRPVGTLTVVRNVVLFVVSLASLGLGVWSYLQGAVESVLMQFLGLFASIDTLPSGIAILVVIVGWLVQAMFFEYLTPTEAVAPQSGPYYRDETTYVTTEGEEIFVPKGSRRAAFLSVDGKYIENAEVAGERGSLVVFLSSTCYLCDLVAPRMAEYRRRVAPLGLAVIESVEGHAPTKLDGALADPYGMGSSRLEVETVPAALVLLPNTSVPVGPVYGPDAIAELVEELEAVLAAATDSQDSP